MTRSIFHEILYEVYLPLHVWGIPWLNVLLDKSNQKTKCFVNFGAIWIQLSGILELNNDMLKNAKAKDLMNASRRKQIWN